MCFECSNLIQFGLSDFHQEFDHWFYWIVDNLLCLHYPLKFEDRLLMESMAVLHHFRDLKYVAWIRLLLLVLRCGRMMLVFSCDFFWWSGLLEYWLRSLFGGIVLVVLSGLESRRTHPVCLCVCVHAQVAWYPRSSLPAFIVRSVKLLCLFYPILINEKNLASSSTEFWILDSQTNNCQALSWIVLSTWCTSEEVENDSHQVKNRTRWVPNEVSEETLDPMIVQDFQVRHGSGEDAAKWKTKK